MSTKKKKSAPRKSRAARAQAGKELAAQLAPRKVRTLIDKAPKVRVSPKTDTGELIAMICKAASERWPEDKSRPGIQIAHIPMAKGELFSVPPKPARWYVAWHRYMHTGGEGRVVAFKTDDYDLDVALVKVGHFVAVPSQARSTLEKMLRAITVLALVLLCAFGTGACAYSTDDNPKTVPTVDIKPSWTACTMITDDGPISDECAPEQHSIERCSSPAQKPNEGCTLPLDGSDRKATESKVWCCP